MIYVMVENLSGSVIASQVLAPLADIAARFGQPSHLLAMERSSICKETDRRAALRGELQAKNVHLSVFVHYGCLHPFTYLSVLSMLARLILLLARCPQEIVLARNFHSALLGIPARWLFPNSYLVLDLRGAFVHELVLRGAIRQGSAAERFLLWGERRAFMKVDSVLAVSHQLASYVRRRCPHPVEVNVIPSCVDPAFFGIDSEAVAALRASLGLTDRFVVVYAGSVTAWNQVEPMLDLFAYLRTLRPNAHFLFLTRSQRDVQAACRQRGWVAGDCTVTEVPHDWVRIFIAAADLGLLLREDNLVNRVASPVKLGEYLACGVPVCVTPYVGDYAGWVREEKVGIVVEHSAEAPFQGLDDFVAEVEACRESFRRRCQGLAERKLSRATYADVYERLLRRASRAKG
jgi:glycosyltransferase involved in cell wall biosynthesis